MRQHQATSNLLGKLRLAVRHDEGYPVPQSPQGDCERPPTAGAAQGWVYPRDVLEALEAVEDVPLPARCGFWAVPGGVAVEVVAREDGLDARRRIAVALERRVPLRGLRVVTDPASLEDPLLLRADLREHSFADFGAVRLRAAEEPVPA
jgi:hypothetical protein